MRQRYFEWTDCSAEDHDRERSVDFPVWAWGGKWTMQEAIPVDDWDPSILALYPPNAAPTDFCTQAEWHIHSGRLKSLVQAAGAAVQYLPFRLCSSVGREEISNYWVANYLRLIDCLDRERTTLYTPTWVPLELGDFAVDHAVLSLRAIGDDILFRVAGFSRLVVVRADLKEQIETAGMTGALFRPLEVTE